MSQTSQDLGRISMRMPKAGASEQQAPEREKMVGIDDADAFCPPEDLLARICRWCVHLSVIGLIVMMGAEMVARSLFGLSIQISGEFGGYALIAICFLSLPSGQLLHAYHRVHFLDHYLGPKGRAWTRLIFDLASFSAVIVLCGVMVDFEWQSWQSGDVAATSVMTPLWIPRMTMVLGVSALAWTLARTLIADVCRVRSFSRQAPGNPA